MDYERRLRFHDFREGKGGRFHVADARGIVVRPDDHHVVFQPRLRVAGVAVGHQVDDRVAGMHRDQVGLAAAEGGGNDVFGSGGDNLDLVAAV